MIIGKNRTANAMPKCEPIKSIGLSGLLSQNLSIRPVFEIDRTRSLLKMRAMVFRQYRKNLSRLGTSAQQVHLGL